MPEKYNTYEFAGGELIGEDVDCAKGCSAIQLAKEQAEDAMTVSIDIKEMDTSFECIQGRCDECHIKVTRTLDS